MNTEQKKEIASKITTVNLNYCLPGQYAKVEAAVVTQQDRDAVERELLNGLGFRDINIYERRMESGIMPDRKTLMAKKPNEINEIVGAAVGKEAYIKYEMLHVETPLTGEKAWELYHASEKQNAVLIHQMREFNAAYEREFAQIHREYIMQSGFKAERDEMTIGDFHREIGEKERGHHTMTFYRYTVQDTGVGLCVEWALSQGETLGAVKRRVVGYDMPDGPYTRYAVYTVKD